MKKSNLITLLSLCFLIIGILLFIFVLKLPFLSSSASVGDNISDNYDRNDSNISPETNLTESGNEKSNSDIEQHLNENSKSDNIKNENISMDDALFIGDSRTVGLMEYAGIEKADFFCSVGMSVYNIYKKPISVPNVGKIALSDLLSKKKYGKIYIMLGINEVGYRLEKTVEKYGELIEFIKERQPDAVIFIQANLHVTKSRSDKDKVVNNAAINKLNGEISKFADNKRKFYMDANLLFDNSKGALSDDKAGDSAHLYAKYYIQWGKWIVNQTASFIKEG